jgi:hypothetical protein
MKAVGRKLRSSARCTAGMAAGAIATISVSGERPLSFESVVLSSLVRDGRA